MQIAEETIRDAMNASLWVTASPHEWTWTHEQQVAMARYCVYASSELSLWRWLTEMRCTVQENSVVGLPRWFVFDVDGVDIGRGETPIEAIENAKEQCEATP